MCFGCAIRDCRTVSFGYVLRRVQRNFAVDFAIVGAGSDCPANLCLVVAKFGLATKCHDYHGGLASADLVVGRWLFVYLCCLWLCPCPCLYFVEVLVRAEPVEFHCVLLESEVVLVQVVDCWVPLVLLPAPVLGLAVGVATLSSWASTFVVVLALEVVVALAPVVNWLVMVYKPCAIYFVCGWSDWNRRWVYFHAMDKIADDCSYRCQP